MKLLLQHRILLGYIILIAVIGTMAAIMFHERNRVQNIESEITEIQEANRTINTAHRHITVLATLGESAITWDEEDYRKYQVRRLRIDSLLQILQRDYEEFVPTRQIDTLRLLLINKEKHLHQAMQLFQQHDSLLSEQLPALARQTRSFRTVTRKKKGLAGLFGSKETVQIPISSKTHHSLNERLILMEEERQQTINAYTDSLRVQNRELNRKLYVLIQDMDEQTQATFQGKELYLQQSYERSTLIVTGLVLSAIVLLVVSYLIIQRDIREKASTQRQLKDTIEQNTALLEMRKKIILTITHDIRGPLNTINGSAELTMDTRNKRERNRYLTNIRILCKHILHLLNNLLDMYRLNESKEKRNDVPFKLDTLLERIATGFTLTVNNKGIVFSHDFTGTDTTVKGDSDRIEQIIDNLLTNAVKFTEAGTIVFTADYKDGTLSLEISDTGIGMDEDMLKRIFQPFERSTPRTNPSGFGLGLAITKGLITLLDGNITVKSETGKGTTFLITLPLPFTTESIEEEEQRSDVPMGLLQRVLVIDDDPMQLEVVREMLERSGILCKACRNVQEIVNEMRKTDYSLLLTDIQMAGTDGIELLGLLRRSDIGNSRTIPVVAMTARGEKTRDFFHKAGFTACLYKPFSKNELLNTLAAAGEANRMADFSTLISDVGDKSRMLDMFISESRKNIAALQSASGRKDREALRETVHRMMPMWEMIQAERALLAYRELLHKEEVTDGCITDHTIRIIQHMEKLIEMAESKKKAIENEEEDINR